eukprot:TRINITY_DN27366_c0_g2_i1.p1 TRINITY_DN27366_c0_g2~~TRINITY_DN27366_c0_g2_i1.p1  ORF type:complete len:478 (+),score=132.09 TRINITY_DN27366_c0_g2_i1:101-1534(+)
MAAPGSRSRAASAAVGRSGRTGVSGAAASAAKLQGPATREEELPPGWVRVESRSKKGAFFYAHPATKRTQVERPRGRDEPRSGHGVAAGEESTADGSPQKRARLGSQGASQVIELDADADRAARDEAKRKADEAAAEAFLAQREAKRQAKLEADRRARAAAEAEEAEREEVVRQARVERRAREQAATLAASDDIAPHEEDLDVVSSEDLERWKESEARREREEAEAAARREEERRRAEEEERERQAEEERRLREEALEMARREEAYEEARREERRRREAEERRKCKELFSSAETGGFASASAAPEAAPSAHSASLLRGREDVGALERGQAPASSSSAPPPRSLEPASASDGGRPAPALPAREPEPKDEVREACLDAVKSGVLLERHPLPSSKKSWVLGRAKGEVDILLNHESVSRRHAEVSRQGLFLFISDLGSAHGTFLDGRRLDKYTPVKLSRGANLRFGGSTRTLVYREPALRL